jgi:multicomponent Na+:H+ antiporter subunit B
MKVLPILTIILLSTFSLPLFLLDTPWPTAPRDFLASRAPVESGARNIVSAIYLGYRAFDTMGEAIVLLLGVSGTIALIKTIPKKSIPHASPPLAAVLMRTNLLNVVSSKLGPIVLVFGLYVMLFGHVSPGGGFQGGVVIASGIVFLALGSRSYGRIGLCDHKTLKRLEALAFLGLIAASLSGLVGSFGFFGNPFEAFGWAPVVYIVILNAIIGIKVGSGIALMCSTMLIGIDDD